jgi:sulfate permease, SulP family
MARNKADDSAANAAPASRLALPILHELYGYRVPTLRADLLSGATVALVSIPQTIGFALIVGIPPQVVLYAAIVGVLFTALFCSSRHLVAGPTTSISIILASSIFILGDRFDPIDVVVTLALLIGLIQVVAGLVKLGTLNRFISRSVIVGYTTGVSLLIATGQINNLLGIPRAQGTDFAAVLINVVRNMAEAQVSLASTGIGVFTVILLLAITRIRPNWPGGLMVLIVFGVIVYLFDLGRFEVLLIRDIGEIIPGLPTIGGGPAPQDMVAMVPFMMSPAIAIAILGMLETVSLSKSVATTAGQRINPNQEIVGLGIGNMMSSIFGTMPGSASFVRTATNYQSGGRTQMAAVFSSFFVAGIVLLFAPFANYIPVASLAGMLIFIAIRMINLEQILIAVNSTRSDAVVFMATFLSTLFLRLDTAIFVGVGTSLVLFLRKAASPHLVEYGFNESGNLAELEEGQRQNDQITIIHVEGELFFGAAEVFQDQIRYLAQDSNIRVFILRLKNARHMDCTSIVALQQLLEFLKKSERHLMISGINDEIERVLINSGFMAKIGRENVFRAEQNPTMSTKRALLRASHVLQSSSPDIRIFYDRRRIKSEDTGPRKEDTGPVNYEI